MLCIQHMTCNKQQTTCNNTSRQQAACNCKCKRAAVCGFVFSYSISWAGGFWVVCSEFFSMRIKAFALSIVLAVMFGGGAVCNTFFLSLKSHLHHNAFLFFGGLCAMATLFVCKKIPETKGKTLSTIQTLLAVSERQAAPTDVKPLRKPKELMRFAPLDDAPDIDAAPLDAATALATAHSNGASESSSPTGSNRDTGAAEDGRA